MITATVQNRRVFVELLLSAPEGQEANIEFVLDSGFIGVTTLDKNSCAALSLPFLRLQPAGLADGSLILLEVYQGTLLWDGEERDVRFQGRDGGFVSIEAL